MPDYERAFREHPLQSTLRGVLGLTKRFSEIESEEPSSHALRVSAAVAHLSTLLDSTNPLLVPTPAMNQLNKSLSSVSTELKSYFDNGNEAHVTNAASYIDGMIQQMGPIRAVSRFESLSEAEEELRLYRENAQNFSSELIRKQGELTKETNAELTKLRTALDAMRTQVDAQKAEIDGQKGRLDKIAEGFQGQFSSDQQARTTQHAEAQRERDAAFKKSEEEREAEWERARKGTEEKHEALVSELKSDSEEALEYLETKRTEAANLLKVTTNITVTGNYNKMATSDRRWGLFWRVLAVILMLGSVYVAWQAIDLALKNDAEFELAAVLLRMGVAAIVALPAVYAARESEKHRRTERQYRRMELELASIDPYIESLPEEQRNTLKQKLADRLFAQQDSIAAEKDETLGFLEDLVKTGWNSMLRKLS